jgi:hypothetical protein
MNASKQVCRQSSSARAAATTGGQRKSLILPLTTKDKIKLPGRGRAISASIRVAAAQSESG